MTPLFVAYAGGGAVGALLSLFGIFAVIIAGIIAAIIRSQAGSSSLPRRMRARRIVPRRVRYREEPDRVKPADLPVLDVLDPAAEARKDKRLTRFILAGGFIAVLLSLIIGGVGAWWWRQSSSAETNNNGPPLAQYQSPTPQPPFVPDPIRPSTPNPAVPVVPPGNPFVPDPIRPSIPNPVVPVVPPGNRTSPVNGQMVMTLDGIPWNPPSLPAQVPIHAPKMDQETVIVPLLSACANLAVGGGGRYLILHLPSEHKLAVFDVNEARIVKYLFVAEDNIKIAAGMDKFIVILCDQKIIQRWSLTTFEREVAVPFEIKVPVIAAAMGSASDGPLLIEGCNWPTLGECVFIDIKTMKKLDLNGQAHNFFNTGPSAWVRASANGKVFANFSHSGGQSCELRGAEFKRYSGGGRWPIPGPDGKVIYTADGPYTVQFQQIGTNRVHCLPAQHGQFYLCLPSDRDGTGKGRISVHRAGDGRQLATVSNIDWIYGDKGGNRDGMTIDKRIHLLPLANLLITIPTTNDKLILHRFDPNAERKPTPKPDPNPVVIAPPPKPDPTPVVVKPQPKPDSRPKEAAPAPKPDRKPVVVRPNPGDTAKPPPPPPEDPVTGAELRQFPVALTKGLVAHMAVSRDGRRVLFASGQNVILYNGETGKELRRLQGHTSYLNDMAFLPDGLHCLAASNDKTVHIWEVESGKEVRSLKHESPARCLAVSGDGRYILSGSGQTTRATPTDNQPASQDCLVRLWETATGKEVRPFQGHTRPVTSVAFAADARQVVSCALFENGARVWNMESGQEVRRIEKFPAGGPSHLNVTPDGRYALFNDHSSNLRLYDLQADKDTRFKTPGNSTSDVVLLPDGRHAVSTGGGVPPKDGKWPKVDCVFRVWEVPEGREVARFEAEGGGLGKVFVTADGHTALTLRGDGVVQVWDLTRRPASGAAGTKP